MAAGLSKDIIPEAERFSEKLPDRVLFEGNCERLRLILTSTNTSKPGICLKSIALRLIFTLHFCCAFVVPLINNGMIAAKQWVNSLFSSKWMLKYSDLYYMTVCVKQAVNIITVTTPAWLHCSLLNSQTELRTFSLTQHNKVKCYHLSWATTWLYGILKRFSWNTGQAWRLCSY